MKVSMEKVSEKVARLMAGSEPEFGFMPIEKSELAVAYSWYAQNKDRSDAENYLKAYCKKEGISVTEEQVRNQVPTLGFTLRMLMRGATLPESSMIWVNNKLERLKSYVPSDDVQLSSPVPQKPKPSVQDHMAEQVRKALGDIDALVDQYILSRFKTEQSPDSILMEHNLKGPHVPKIVDYYKKQRDEIRKALDRTDDQLTEAYAPYYRPDLKKLEAYYDKIIGAALHIQTKTVTTRKPRTRKPKSPEKLTAKLKYASGIPSLNIASIPAKKIIEAESLWVFNVKTRKLGVYHADDRRGLSIKGQTIMNYSESRSVCKKVRKPERVLPDFMSARKTALSKLFDEIVAIESPMSGRLNKDTVLLKVIEY